MDTLTKGDIRRQKQAEHAARIAAGTTHSQKSYIPEPRKRRPRVVRDRGYLGTRASMDAYLSGAPMSSDDY